MDSTLSYTPVDRPDIVKRGKSDLTFKEVKDCIFKFLSQIDIQFSGPQRLYLTTEYAVKHNPEAANVELHNQNYYPVTCKLNNVTVNGFPVYMVVLSGTLSGLDNRQKNKLLFSKGQHNLLIFDATDWEYIGLDISNKKWLAPLTKQMLRKLARRLFQKLGALEGTVNSTFTLNDLLAKIDSKSEKSNDLVPSISKLKSENLDLKTKLNINYLSNKVEVKPEHSVIIRKLTKLSTPSAKWLEYLVYIIADEIRKINLSKSEYSKHFSTKSGQLKFNSPSQLATFIGDKLHSKRLGLEIENLGCGALRIKNTVTLQEISIWASLHTKTPRVIVLPKQVAKVLNKSLLLNFNLIPADKRIKETAVFAVLKEYCSKEFIYNSAHRLKVFDGKTCKFRGD
jgi:hypothetical protein